MKVGVVGEIHPSGYEIFDKNNIEYFVTNNIDEDHLIEKLRDILKNFLIQALLELVLG